MAAWSLWVIQLCIVLRLLKTDNLQLWQTKNDTYTVSKLPALPDQIRTDIAGIYHSFIDL